MVISFRAIELLWFERGCACYFLGVVWLNRNIRNFLGELPSIHGNFMVPCNSLFFSIFINVMGFSGAHTSAIFERGCKGRIELVFCLMGDFWDSLGFTLLGLC